MRYYFKSQELIINDSAIISARFSPAGSCTVEESDDGKAHEWPAELRITTIELVKVAADDYDCSVPGVCAVSKQYRIFGAEAESFWKEYTTPCAFWA